MSTENEQINASELADESVEGLTIPDDPKRARKSPRRKTDAEKIADNERLRKALEMRKSGYTYAEIVESLGHWKSPQAAQSAVVAVLERALLDDARELKLQNLVRLETALAPIMEKVKKGNLLAVDRLIKISKREGEILGFDAASEKDLTVGFEIVVKDESERPRE